MWKLVGKRIDPNPLDTTLRATHHRESGKPFGFIVQHALGIWRGLGNHINPNRPTRPRFCTGVDPWRAHSSPQGGTSSTRTVYPRDPYSLSRPKLASTQDDYLGFPRRRRTLPQGNRISPSRPTRGSTCRTRSTSI